MTFSKLLDNYKNLLLDCKTEKEYQELKNQEVNVFFDFPLVPGSGTAGYKIASITKQGIIIRNDDIQRPIGH